MPTLSVRITHQMAEAIREYGDDNHCVSSDFVRVALAEQLKRRWPGKIPEMAEYRQPGRPVNETA